VKLADSKNVRYTHPPYYQHGAVLIVSMLLLLVMTLIGITGMRNTTLEEKMAGNTRDSHLAFNAAEAGLRESESLLQAAVLPAFKTYDGINTGGYYHLDSTIWQKINWGDAKMVLDCGAVVPGVAAAPVCYVEELPAVGSPADLEAGIALTNTMFRVTARAVGGSSTAEAILQATFRR